VCRIAAPVPGRARTRWCRAGVLYPQELQLGQIRRRSAGPGRRRSVPRHRGHDRSVDYGGGQRGRRVRGADTCCGTCPVSVVEMARCAIRVRAAFTRMRSVRRPDRLMPGVRMRRGRSARTQSMHAQHAGQYRHHQQHEQPPCRAAARMCAPGHAAIVRAQPRDAAVSADTRPLLARKTGAPMSVIGHVPRHCLPRRTGGRLPMGLRSPLSDAITADAGNNKPDKTVAPYAWSTPTPPSADHRHRPQAGTSVRPRAHGAGPSRLPGNGATPMARPFRWKCTTSAQVRRGRDPPAAYQPLSR
jgi:hypothetical protein